MGKRDNGKWIKKNKSKEDEGNIKKDNNQEQIGIEKTNMCINITERKEKYKGK